MEADSLAVVNHHYLDRVVTAAEHHEIETSEDIYTENGIKLLAKGARISPSVQQRLIIHKLKKPLESCLQVSQGVDANRLIQIGQTVIEDNPGLAPLFADFGLLPRLRDIPLNPAVVNMLTVACAHDPNSLRHYVLVTLLSLGLGRRLKLTETELGVLASAALLHDIGELYIDQRHLDRRQVLTPEAWRHVSVHPVVGATLAGEVCGMPSEVTEAILQHHERGDGGGYPRGIAAPNLSRAGRVLAAAEMIASLTEHGAYPLERAEVALRIVPVEYDPVLVSVVSQALGEARVSEYQMPDTEYVQDMHALLRKIAVGAEVLGRCRAEVGQHGEACVQLLARVEARFVLIQRAFSSTGLDVVTDKPHFDALIGDASGWLRFELSLVLREIRWRLRELARDLALRASLQSAAVAAYFQPLVQLLHDG
ncbi:HD-GYP domain-containing protein [Chitiniphilus eburneus]|uniref:HD domain-containing protein n=1 Tax=Chitiniphilus eburneus TaxID=2571148 RepID=A0A4U0PY57_9NEIS|nr:HD domain-containing phosphohydrolase [Chitiniphilus eburneus]TJZ73541.1 HD domain-containing protein [Chitiniphilus eburneus]